MIKVPEIFWQKYKEILTEQDFIEFKKYCWKGLRKSIRVNTIKISVKEFKKITKPMWWILSPIPWCDSGFWIDREDKSTPLWKTYLHQAGYFYVQEASSMIPPEILSPNEGETILDFASAPWSKTTQLTSKVNNKWVIVANEPEGKRIKALNSNIERTGAVNVITTKKDWQVFSWYFPNFFDKILLDAPCSWEWTIRKDKSALEFWNDKKVEAISNLQIVLIEHAFQALKPGGEMVYSTCTLSPEENEFVVEYILERYKNNAELIPLNPKWAKPEIHSEFLPWTLRIWPQTYDSEWFFIAKIKKNSPTEDSSFLKTRRDSPFSKLSKKTLNWLNSEFNRMFGIKLNDTSILFERSNQIFIRPEKSETITSKIIADQQWILFAERHKQEIKITHSWAMFLAQSYDIQKWVVELNSEQCNDFIMWKDVFIPSDIKQYVFLKHNWLIIGIGKSLKNKIKNSFPRHLCIV